MREEVIKLLSNRVIKGKNMKKGIDYIGVTVVFFCHDGKGNFLLHKRSQNCRDEQGCWDCGGGAMKFGETFEQAVRREVEEEYCTHIKDLRFIETSNILREQNGFETHWIALIFAVEIDCSHIKNGDTEKIDEMSWFTLDSLPKPLHSKLPETLNLMKKEGIL